MASWRSWAPGIAWPYAWPKIHAAQRLWLDLPRPCLRGFHRLTCQHKGIYADDCIHTRVEAHRCYIVCTNDKDLKRRIRKVSLGPGSWTRSKKHFGKGHYIIVDSEC